LAVLPEPFPPPQPATKPLAFDVEAEILSKRELRQRAARNGVRIFAWIILMALLGINYKLIIAIWNLAAHAWPKG
jgi:hypothetical protein